VAIMVGVACGCSDEGSDGWDDVPFSYQVRRFLNDVNDALFHGE